MGRKNNRPPGTVSALIPKGRLIYALYVRRTRAQLRGAEKRAEKRQALLDTRLAMRLTRREQVQRAIDKRLDRIERHPSKLGVQILRDLVQSRSTPEPCKARASTILLRWMDGDFSYERRGRPGQKSRRNQGVGA